MLARPSAIGQERTFNTYTYQSIVYLHQTKPGITLLTAFIPELKTIHEILIMTVPTSKVTGKRPSKDDLLTETEYTHYFKSKEHEIAFYFKLNKPDFDIRLGIKRVHLVDMEKARELRKAYLSMFHSDTNEGSRGGLDCDEICADINAVFRRVSGGKL